MTSRLDFSIGPVQGFVAQSCRTRDLWGSSYLLSFLSAWAMRGIEEAGGEVIEPLVTEDLLYQWVCGHRGGDAPRIGSLPNRFAVKVDGDSRAVACAGVKALNDAWLQVSGAVWEKFVKDASCDTAATQAIWDRQITSFWEVTWTAGQPNDHLLARRKHWRSHRLPDEPGDKCTVMHDLQELSGYIRSQGDGNKQDRFWECVREQTGQSDLRNNERLCAIALVKRLFPKTGKEALGWEVKATHWPSTINIAARPWIHHVQSTVPDMARRYVEAVKLNAPNDVLSERGSVTPGANNSLAGDFPSLDANYYHRGFIKNERLCPLGNGDAQDQLDRLLKDIYQAKAEEGNRIGPPPSFYALLLADGDRLGTLAGTLGKQRVGEALARFTQKIPNIVKKHGGQTIYAGGDDVLAMHPAPEALCCAMHLAKCYRRAFGDAADATLSATVLFAHVRSPLSAVISEAHRLLDNVAKDENGRDSLAVGVLKSGKLNCQWVTTWDRAQGDAVTCLNNLTRLLGASAMEPEFSSALVYRIRDMLTRLCEWDSWQPGFWGDVPTALDVPALLRADMGHSLGIRMSEGQGMNHMHVDTARLADLVWRLMQRSRKTARAGDGKVEAGLDSLLLARFLACTAHGEADG